MATPTHKDRQAIPIDFAARVLERAPVDAAALAIASAPRVQLCFIWMSTAPSSLSSTAPRAAGTPSPRVASCVERYEALQRAALAYAATFLRESGRGFPELHDCAEFALLDGEATAWARRGLMEIHGDRARHTDALITDEEQVTDCCRLLDGMADRAFADAKKKGAK